MARIRRTGVTLNTGKLPAPRDLPWFQARDEGGVPPDRHLGAGVPARTCAWCEQRFTVKPGTGAVCARCADLETVFEGAVAYLAANGLRPVDGSVIGETDAEARQRRLADDALAKLMGFRRAFGAGPPADVEPGPLARMQAANEAKARAQREQAAVAERQSRGKTDRSRAQASKAERQNAAGRRANIQTEIDRQVSLGGERTTVSARRWAALVSQCCGRS